MAIIGPSSTYCTTKYTDHCGIAWRRNSKPPPNANK